MSSNLIQILTAAHTRIQPFIHRTPVLTSESINAIAGCQLYFKCENFQKVGAFKMRGAMNAVLQLSSKEKAQGVATHSSGNHAAALALAAKLQGIKAYIVMPENAPEIKKKAVAGYGAEIIFCTPTLAARESTLAEVIQKTGAVFIPPYNHQHVIEGQSTAAKEFFEQTANLDVIMTPVGGGGLLAGTALAASVFSPNTAVIAAEPKGADDAYRSFYSGKLVESQVPNTIADGLLTTLGPINFEIIKKHVQSIITVDDNEIIAAMRLIWERMKIIVEPSCAVPLAVVLNNKEAFESRRVGIILSGGNVDLGKLPF